MAGETGVTSPQVAERRQLLAVVYMFDSFAGGEQRLLAQEQIPASAQGMLERQLQAVPKRTLIDYGPGLLVYDSYQDALFAARTIAKVAAHVALREVAAGDTEGGEVWTSASGGRYGGVHGGLAEMVKD